MKNLFTNLKMFIYIFLFLILLIYEPYGVDAGCWKRCGKRRKPSQPLIGTAPWIDQITTVGPGWWLTHPAPFRTTRKRLSGP